MSSIIPDLPPPERSSRTVAAGDISEGPTGTLLEAAELKDRAQQLRLVANRIEEFLVQQIERLQQVIAEAQLPSDQAELGAMRDDFERMRDQWEIERQREIQKLREDGERLIEAWKYLEKEQRDLLLRQAAIRSTPAPAMMEGDSHLENGPLHPVRVSPAGAVAAVGAEIGGLVGSATIQKAQLQFQQLRREMQRHARQRKKY